MEHQIKVIGAMGNVVTVAADNTDLAIGDYVIVGDKGLLGEVFSKENNTYRIMLFENARGVRHGDKVRFLSHGRSILLGPGIVGGLYDGLGRPLDKMGRYSDGFSVVPTVDENRKWSIEFVVFEDDVLSEGQTFAYVREPSGFVCTLRVPKGNCGKVISIEKNGEYAAYYTLVVLKDEEGNLYELSMLQSRAVKKYGDACFGAVPENAFLTNVKFFDEEYPINCGTCSALLCQNRNESFEKLCSVAFCAEYDVLVYVNCGGRTNDILRLRKELEKREILKKTVMFTETAGASETLVESLLDSALTVAEYYRDMGYKVLVLVDSLSTFALCCKRNAELRTSEVSVDDILLRIYDRVFALSNADDFGSITLIGFESGPQTVSEFSSLVGTCICFENGGINAERSFSRYRKAVTGGIL